MTAIVRGVKADQVAVKKALEDVVAHRQHTVNFATREWRVEEEADLDVVNASILGGNLLAKHLRQEHEVIVVNPDEVIVLDVLGDLLCKLAVGVLVGSPVGLVKGDVGRVVMKDSPQDLVY